MEVISKKIQEYIFATYEQRIKLLNQFLDTSDKEIENKYYECSMKISAIERVNFRYLNTLLENKVNGDHHKFIYNHLIECILKKEGVLAAAKIPSLVDGIPEDKLKRYFHELKVEIIALKELLKVLGCEKEIIVETVVVVDDDEPTNNYTN